MITENQYKILKVMSDEYGGGFIWLSQECGLDVKIIKKEMPELKKLGYVYSSQLFDDDGMLNGSGFLLQYPASKIYDLVREYEEKGMTPLQKKEREFREHWSGTIHAEYNDIWNWIVRNFKLKT